MKRVIVTGANGFVGSAVIRELIKNDVEVLALCHKIPEKKIISDLITYKEFELSKIEELKDIVINDYYDTFYHFAWAGVSVSQRTNVKIQLQNTRWTIDALNFAKSIGCKRFIGVGSIMEHETIRACYTDDNKPGLGYIYGSAKMSAHTMAMSIAANIGIELIWAEITNAYGAGEISSRLINTTIRKIINKESPQFTSGTQNYDFVYIDDVARAFYLIGKNGRPFHSYLIGSGNAKPLKEFLLEMKETIAKDVDFIFGDVPFTGVNLDLSVFDAKKTERDTGFKAEISFAEGILKTYNWLREYNITNDRF